MLQTPDFAWKLAPEFFLYFLHFFDFLSLCTFVLCHLVGQSIWISMQNLESVAQKMAELWVLLYFVKTVYTNFHAKSGLCSSRNDRIMLNLVFGACGAASTCTCASVPVTNLRIELRASKKIVKTNCNAKIFKICRFWQKMLKKTFLASKWMFLGLLLSHSWWSKCSTLSTGIIHSESKYSIDRHYT